MSYRPTGRDHFRLPGRKRPRGLRGEPPRRKRSWLPRSWAARLVGAVAAVLVVATVLIIWNPFAGNSQGPHNNGTNGGAVQAPTPTQAPLHTTGGPTPSASATATPGLSFEGAVPPPAGSGPTPSAESARFQVPLHTAAFQIIDRFGSPRANGLVLGGVDLAVASGTPVFSACSGNVTFAGYTPDTYGNYVVVDCGQGWSTLYAHLGATVIQPGAGVSNQVQLGVVGSQGYSSGPLLHFEIRYQNVPVNPQDYMSFQYPPPATPVSGPAIATPTSHPTHTPATATPSSAAATATSPALPGATPTRPPRPTATVNSRPTATPTPTLTPTPTATPTATPTQVIRPRPTPTPPIVQY